MKKENLIKVLKDHLKGDVNIEESIDLDAITEEWNRQINGAVKAETERVNETSKQDILKELGVESVDELKGKLTESTKKQEEQLTEFESLKKDFDQLKGELTEKEKSLITRDRKDLLAKTYNLKPERLDRAYKLIEGELGEDGDFDTIAKQFVEDTPEWVNGAKNPAIDLGGDEGDPPPAEDEADKMAKSWD